MYPTHHFSLISEVLPEARETAERISPHTATSSSRRSFGLDFARVVAICLVLVSHYGHSKLDFLGFWGVELFFALSGFLIGHILWRNFAQTTNWSWAHITNFWARRWWRTLPNYYFFLFILVVAEQWQTGQLHAISQFSSFLWFGQYLISHNYGFYSVSWSLCVEEWFYLLFPLALLVFSRVGLSSKKTYLISLATFFVLSFFFRHILLYYKQGHDLREITFARLDSIACGVAVAYWQITATSFKEKAFCFCIGVVLVLSALMGLLYTGNDYAQCSWVLIVAPLGFALTLPLISLWQLPENYAILRVGIEKISLWSYSIYLSHMPVMWLVYFSMDKQRTSTFGNLLSKIIGVCITIVLSGLLFGVLEKPMTKKRPRELTF